MTDNTFKIKAIGEIKKLKSTDYCQVLNEMKNIHDPVIIRLHIDADSTTVVDFNYNDDSNEGKNPYAGGFYLVEIHFGKSYPEKTPTVLFRTPILHANISKTDGYICLEALNRWKSSSSLEENIVRPLRDLLITPNFDDMIGGIDEKIVRDYDTIRENVLEYATLERTDEHVERLLKRIQDDKERAASNS